MTFNGNFNFPSTFSSEKNNSHIVENIYLNIFLRVQKENHYIRVRKVQFISLSAVCINKKKTRSFINYYFNKCLQNTLRRRLSLQLCANTPTHPFRIPLFPLSPYLFLHTNKRTPEKRKQRVFSTPLLLNFYVPQLGVMKFAFSNFAFFSRLFQIKRKATKPLACKFSNARRPERTRRVSRLLDCKIKTKPWNSC